MKQKAFFKFLKGYHLKKKKKIDTGFKGKLLQI